LPTEEREEPAADILSGGRNRRPLSNFASETYYATGTISDMLVIVYEYKP